MNILEIFTSLAGFCCFYDDENLSLAGTYSDLSAILGYTPEEFKNKFNNQLLAAILPNDRADFLNVLHTQFANSDQAELVFRMRKKNGRAIWILAKICSATDDDGNECFCAVMSDCTKYKNLQDNADNLMHQYQIILSQTHNVTFELDVQTDTISFSDSWKEMFNYTPETRNFVATLPSKAHIYPADVPRLLQGFKKMKKGNSYQTLDLRISNGKKFLWFCLRATAMYDEYGKLLKIIGILLDIDESKRAASDLKKQAERDPLTKLLNKEACKQQIDEYLNSFENGAYCAMMIIDLDNFKHINDYYGHMFGDTIILKATQAIKAFFRDRDIVSRFGGDEFMVLMKDISNRELIGIRCQKMLDYFQELLEKENIRGVTGFSIGVSLSPTHATTYETLFKCADDALYEVKKRGKNNYEIFQPK
ncbi:MAG: sensor domain-containing diguanylate cyclase [Lachnospiraceae bacterium]|nr:sensor domain-containing diguanylate cyclase [Lachnospiraceae bacterium]